jgi:hypothetical protein
MLHLCSNYQYQPDLLFNLPSVRIASSCLPTCVQDKQASYQYDEGKESTLVRIVLRTIPGEYDMAVKSVHDMVRFRKAGETGALAKITNLQDNSRKNYSEDWFSPYEESHAQLINS